MDPDHGPVWYAEYTRNAHEDGRTVTKKERLDDIVCHECPTGMLDANPRLVQVLHAVDSARTVHQGSGGVLGGQNSGKWPCWWYDAVEIVTNERRRVEALYPR